MLVDVNIKFSLSDTLHMLLPKRQALLTVRPHVQDTSSQPRRSLSEWSLVWLQEKQENLSSKNCKKKKKKASRLTGQVRNIMSDSCVGFTLKVPKKESSEIDLGFWFSPLYLGKDTDCCLSGKP